VYSSGTERVGVRVFEEAGSKFILKDTRESKRHVYIMDMSF
jgi:hypothetical protein